MNEERAILHSDLNSFYASVEMMLDPSLKGKAVAVCGSTENWHGIVLAKSERAKKAGVKTGMVNREAKQLCKDLIMVPPQYDQYLKYSKLTRSIYERYTDQVEPFGMDECWLDVTGSRVQGSPMEIAEQIRKSIKEELGLTVSIGVSFNKIFAKLGSDMKKPDAITEITKAEFKEKVWPLHCSEMIYCGPATTKKLAMFGIDTIGDIANTDPAFLKQILGVNGLSLSGVSRASKLGFRPRIRLPYLIKTGSIVRLPSCSIRIEMARMMPIPTPMMQTTTSCRWHRERLRLPTFMMLQTNLFVRISTIAAPTIIPQLTHMTAMETSQRSRSIRILSGSLAQQHLQSNMVMKRLAGRIN